MLRLGSKASSFTHDPTTPLARSGNAGSAGAVSGKANGAQSPWRMRAIKPLAKVFVEIEERRVVAFLAVEHRIADQHIDVDAPQRWD